MRSNLTIGLMLVATPLLILAVFLHWQPVSPAAVHAQEITPESSAAVEASPTPTATPDISISLPITGTATLTTTIVVSPTATLTATPTATQEPTATQSPYSYLPIIIREPTPTPDIPPQKVLFCDTLGERVYIPDDDPFGVSNEIYVADQRLITDLDIALDIRHTWVGDLVVNLTHLDSGRSVNLIDRPGIPATSQGCYENNIFTILDDEISSPAEWKCASDPAAISGIYLPNTPLNTFDGESAAGSWSLQLSDNYKNDTGYLSGWCLVASISPYWQSPTPTPPPPQLPIQAQIYGISGRNQALPLDCESRSAVDWAAYFGYSIGELTFFNLLPHSDNPDKGFVGNVYDPWGNIPPKSYGVHAEPVAALLRSYGVTAYAHRPLSWDQLRAEIAAGRPVVV
ncbi:MAG: proprotein convertase P-domain-containing protein, partial [Anaerolineales bacterium]